MKPEWIPRLEKEARKLYPTELEAIDWLGIVVSDHGRHSWTNGEKTYIHESRTSSLRSMRFENVRMLGLTLYAPRLRGQFLVVLRAEEPSLIRTLEELELGRCVSYVVAQHPHLRELMQHEPVGVLDGLTNYYLDHRPQPSSGYEELARRWMRPWKTMQRETDRTYNRAKIELLKDIHRKSGHGAEQMGVLPTHEQIAPFTEVNRAYKAAKDLFGFS